MKLPQAEWQAREGMRGLLDALGASQGDTRYVGGCVRDRLLGLPVSDIDLATRLTPQEVMERLREAAIKAVPTGIDHGTVTAVLPDGPVEVTTLRRDVSTDGRRATVAFTGEWREDAARRDFTINALFADPDTLELFDYHEGLADLKLGLVRFIGDPLTRIAEDHLRILRFFRFHARFGGKDLHKESLDACMARANDLMALSRERIADEMVKLLSLADPAPSVALMVDRGILKPVLPEVGTAGVIRLRSLIIAEMDAAIAPDGLRRLAALLPDEPDVAAGVGARLRLSNRAVKRLVSAACRNRQLPDAPEALAYHLGAEEAIDCLLLLGRPAEAARLREWTRPKFLIGGGDLIAMGLTPGPIVAKTLQAAEREWAASGFVEDAEEQRRLARRHVDQALRSSQ